MSFMVAGQNVSLSISLDISYNVAINLRFFPLSELAFLMQIWKPSTRLKTF